MCRAYFLSPQVRSSAPATLFAGCHKFHYRSNCSGTHNCSGMARRHSFVLQGFFWNHHSTQTIYLTQQASFRKASMNLFCRGNPCIVALYFCLLSQQDMSRQYASSSGHRMGFGTPCSYSIESSLPVSELVGRAFVSEW